MIEFKNVYKIYHMGDSEVRAIDGISFTIDKGGICGHCRSVRLR